METQPAREPHPRRRRRLGLEWDVIALGAVTVVTIAACVGTVLLIGVQ